MSAVSLTVFHGSLEPGWIYSAANQQPHSALWIGTAIRYAYTDEGNPGVLQNSASNADDTGTSFNTFSSVFGDVSFASYSTTGGTVAGSNMMSLDWQGDTSAVISLNQAWNSSRGIEISQFNGTTLVLRNWVDAWVHLSDDLDHAITLDGSKRGEVTLGNGNNTVAIGAEANDPNWTIGFKIVTGNGNDTITIGLSSQNYVGGAYDGTLTKTWIDAGAGNDIVHGGAGDDMVNGGAGDDLIDTGGGNDDIWGATGQNIIAGGCGFDTAHFAVRPPITRSPSRTVESRSAASARPVHSPASRSLRSPMDHRFASCRAPMPIRFRSWPMPRRPELSALLLANDKAIDDCDALRITGVETGAPREASISMRPVASCRTRPRIRLPSRRVSTARINSLIRSAMGMAASAPRLSRWTSLALTMQW